MEDEINYKPNMDVVRSCRAFIRSLSETYGSSQGMAVWDKVREVLGDRAAGDIMFGMLTTNGEIRVVNIGPNMINVIKALRGLTGWGLKESKDFCDLVRDGKPQVIDTSYYDDNAVTRFIEELRFQGGKID